MLKNSKLLNRISMAILAVFLCAANFAFAADSNYAILKAGIIKYSTVLFAIVITSVVLTVGLSIYNRFFVRSQENNYKLNRDSLKSPETKDEAVLMYISKNRLK